MKILAIDPGTERSAYVVWNGKTCVATGIVENRELRSILLAGDYDSCAIEMVACYGMAVGKEVFETCLWIGRFMECWLNGKHPAPVEGTGFFGNAFTQVYRREIKSHFCNSAQG